MFHKNNTEKPAKKISISELEFKYRLIIAIGIFALGIVLFLINKGKFYDYDNNGHLSLLKKILVMWFGCFGVMSLSAIIDNKLSDAVNKIINLSLMEFYPMVCFFIVELTIGTDCRLIIMNLRRLILNIALYMIVYYLFYAITASVRVSVIGLSAFTTLFAAANIYLLRFRQIPLMATDFMVVRTALNVAGDFDYTPDIYVMLLIAYLIAVIIASSKIKENNKLRKNIPFRAVVAVLYIGFFGFMFHLLIRTDYLQEKYIQFNTFRPTKSYTKNGGLLTFTKSIQLCMFDKPDGYSEKAVDDIADDYPSDSVEDLSKEKKPNVIVIMNEAFSDLQAVGEFETNEEVLPFYNSMKENTIKGFTYVSVFGGQTANTEYEFLTGDSKAFLPENSTPYQLYIKEYMPSLTGNMVLNGYQGNLAIHPFYGSGYNRVNVYNNFGFSEFLDMYSFENPTYIRDFISDTSDFNKIIEEYEKSKANSDDPFYVFNVTMQNHSSYDMDFDTLPKTIKITTEDKKNDDAERYLNLVHLSDAALKDLIGYFEKEEEPTVIVMFGDHEPGISDKFYEKLTGKKLDKMTGLESMELYKTPFLIWANYDIEEEYIDKISVNYLHSLMLEKTGLNMTGYNKFLLDMYEEIPVITGNGYIGADGNFYKKDDVTSPYYEIIEKYNMIVYNHLFDVKNRNSFFEYTK